MRPVISIDEMVAETKGPQGRVEVCASAVGDYDEPAGRLTVRLNAFVRPTGTLAPDFHPDWIQLPAPQTVEEHVDYAEAAPLTREMFRAWVKKVRHALESRPAG
ncbi:MAG TPA: hypothetical protein VNO52_18515 [Methylomirabilota bacterium]|nr:hypothetical protein [Methylomirabilota bacterium]